MWCDVNAECNFLASLGVNAYFTRDNTVVPRAHLYPSIASFASAAFALARRLPTLPPVPAPLSNELLVNNLTAVAEMLLDRELQMPYTEASLSKTHLRLSWFECQARSDLWPRSATLSQRGG